MAEELDTISGRIRKLTEALRLVGVYDGSAEGIGKLLESGQDNEMIGISNMSALIGKSTAAGGGLNGVVQFLPMNEVAQTLLNLYQARDQAKNTLYEMIGDKRYRARPGRSPREGQPVQDQGAICYAETRPAPQGSGENSA